MLFMSLIKLMFFLVGKNQGQIVNNVQSCRSLLSMYAPMVERACSGHANWRHNAWNVVTSQSLLRLEIRLRRRLLWLIKIFSVSNCSNSLPGSSISFLQTNFTILSFFFLKIAKRVKENKRLSNFRNIACQLVTEIGQTCGIGLIVSNQRLILFCIIQMTFFLISLLNTLYIHTTESTYALNAIFVMSLRFVSFFSAHRCTLCKRLSCVEQETRSKGKFMQ